MAEQTVRLTAKDPAGRQGRPFTEQNARPQNDRAKRAMQGDLLKRGRGNEGANLHHHAPEFVGHRSHGPHLPTLMQINAAASGRA